MWYFVFRLPLGGALLLLSLLVLAGCGSGPTEKPKTPSEQETDAKPKEAKLPKKRELPKETLPSEQKQPPEQPPEPEKKPALPAWPVVKQIEFGQPVKDLALSGDGKILVAAGGNKVEAFSTENWESVQIVTEELKAANSVSLSPDGTQLAVSQTVFGPAGKVAWWKDWRSGQPVFFEAHTGVTFCLSFGPPGNPLLATAGNDRYIKLWQPETQTPISTLRGHEDLVGQLAFAPDGRRLVSGSADGKVLLWNLTGSDQPREAKQHVKDVTALAFTHSGKQFASGGEDNSIFLWQIDSLREPRGLFGHRAVVTGLAFSPQGQVLVSCSGDKTVTAWNLAKERERVAMTAHTDYVNCVAFSPDGKFVISGSDDQTIRIWEVPPAWQALDAE